VGPVGRCTDPPGPSDLRSRSLAQDEDARSSRPRRLQSSTGVHAAGDNGRTIESTSLAWASVLPPGWPTASVFSHPRRWSSSSSTLLASLIRASSARSPHGMGSRWIARALLALPRSRGSAGALRRTSASSASTASRGIRTAIQTPSAHSAGRRMTPALHLVTWRRVGRHKKIFRQRRRQWS
jgi:hypothetical protein